MSPERVNTIEINRNVRFARLRELLGIQAVTMPDGVPEDMRWLYRRVARGKKISIIPSAEMAPISGASVAGLRPATLEEAAA
jgi:hypothetical protein